MRATGTTTSMGTVTDDLAGRRILVTGASKGIGRGVAAALAELGASLALVARDAAVLGDLVGGLTGGPHDAIAFDVADEQAWLAARPKIAPTGRLDGAVTAAAVIGPIGRVGEWRVDDFRRTLDVNVAGTLLAVTTCLEALRGGGSVVTFSGGGATAPFPRFDSYATSKAAVVRLTENLAVELAPDDIRLNAIAPGFIVTPMHANILAAGPGAVGSQFFERTRAAHETRRGGPPELVYELVAYLLSEESAGITGRVIERAMGPLEKRCVPRTPADRARPRDTAADRRPVLRAGATGTRMTANRAEAGHASTPAAPARKMLSVVIPAYNEEDNVPGIYARLAPTLDGLDCDWEVIFCVDPSTDRTEQVILELRRARPTRPDAALLAAIRPADGDDRRARGGVGRCRRRHRLRSAGPSRAHRRAGREMARRLRRRLRAAPYPGRRDPREADRGGGWLPPAAAHRQRRHPAEHRRLPVDEPTGRRRRRVAARAARVLARPGRLRRVHPDERALRPGGPPRGAASTTASPAPCSSASTA